MPRYVRSGSGAVIIEYTKPELEESVGYRLQELERRVRELEKVVKGLMEKFYIYKEKAERGKAVGD